MVIVFSYPFPIKNNNNPLIILRVISKNTTKAGIKNLRLLRSCQGCVDIDFYMVRSSYFFIGFLDTPFLDITIFLELF